MALPDGGYNAKDHESEILKFWLENKYYKPEYNPVTNSVSSTEEMLNDGRETWTLICPPPNAYGRPHIGNISGYAYMDAMARYQRMNGKKVLVLPGKDHAGLEGEGVFVREVLEKQKRYKFDMKREDFYSEMMTWMHENMDKAIKDEQEIGLSADYDRNTFTLDPDVVETVLDTFVEMYNEGRIYKGVRIVNWDPKARTAVADNQIEYEEATTPFYYFKYAFTQPEEKAIELKTKYENMKMCKWTKVNHTLIKDSEISYQIGTIENSDDTVLALGFDKADEGLTREGKVIGIQMRLDNKFRVVIINPRFDGDKNELIFKAFTDSSKLIAGSHFILFDEYPEDKFYTNGFVLGTVRPETKFGDTAIAVNPKDERYKDYVGKEFEVQTMNGVSKIKVVSDFAVEKEFGTGMVKVTPAHSAVDWEIAQRHPEDCLPAKQVINYNLTLNHLCGKYEGMKIKEAREVLRKDMKEIGMLLFVDENYKNRIAIAERTKAPIEPLLSSQWYLKYDGIKEAAKKMVNNEGTNHGLSVRIHPESMVSKFNHWMDNLRDWAISRSLWWGYRLPVWYHGEVKEEIGGNGEVRELIKLGAGREEAGGSENGEMRAEVLIRKATRDDAKRMHEISVNGWYQNFIDEERGITKNVLINKYGKDPNNKESLEKFAKHLDDKNEISYVAEKDEKVIGWVNLENLNTPEVNWLNIYVAKEHQKEGIGTMLMDKILNEYPEIEIHIATPEKANLQSFYSKFGFIEYPVEGRKEGGLYMIQMKRVASFESSKTILVDAVGTLINSNESKAVESYSLNKDLAEYLSQLSSKVIIVTNATGESFSAIEELLKGYNFEIFTLHKNPEKNNSEYFNKLISTYNLKTENIIYIDHKDENVSSAIKAGILNSLVSDSNEHRIKFIEVLNTKHQTPNTLPDHESRITNHWTLLEYNNPNHLRVQKESPGEGWLQDENVLDTWFSSGQWVYATLEKYGLMKEFFPTDVMVSGFDILENWISRMMMFTYFKHKDIPFKNVYLTGLVKGTDGQKMSKSRGNVLSIDDLREKYGTDAVRMVYFYQNSAGADYAMTYEKLDTFKKFVNKLWNASKFVLMNVEDMESGAGGQETEIKFPENKALYDHVVKTKKHITKNIEKFELGLATYNLYHAFWDEFADIHIEAVKKYTYTQKDKVTGEIISEPKPEDKLETQKVLLFALREYLKMLHPFIPFVTERIWKEMPKQEGDHESLMYSRW